jgi:hypothetical protein
MFTDAQSQVDLIAAPHWERLFNSGESGSRTYLPENCVVATIKDGVSRRSHSRVTGYDSALPRNNDRRSNPFKSLSVGK